MRRPRLIVVCGIPGAGKSTFARRASDRWGAASFASETFAEQLGPAARAASGDLSKEAIAHAYAAMRDAAAEALSRSPLVLAVGSFRAEPQRKLFRDNPPSRCPGRTPQRVKGRRNARHVCVVPNERAMLRPECIARPDARAQTRFPRDEAFRRLLMRHRHVARRRHGGERFEDRRQGLGGGVQRHVGGVQAQGPDGGVVHAGREGVGDRVPEHGEEAGASADLHAALPSPGVRRRP